MTREEFINIYCLPRYNTDGSLIKIIIEDSGIKRIPPYIFYDCKLLESITIPDSIIAIGNHAFAGCESLSNIILPNKLIRIEDHAFHGCSSLESIIIPPSVEEIGNFAFAECKSFQTITFSDRLELRSIGFGAFKDCVNLKHVIWPKECEHRDGYIFIKRIPYCDIISDNIIEIGKEAFPTL